MYTRDFRTAEAENFQIPESYGGTAFDEEASEEVHKEIPESRVKRDEGLAGIFKSFIPTSLFGGSLPFGRGFKFGAEEILIIGIAAFLFFSKDGDRECALMLVALLFIT